MIRGVVKLWDSAKGYGFITTEENEDIFVHSSDLHPSVRIRRLIAGQKVIFDLKQDMKGDRAVNVRVP